MAYRIIIRSFIAVLPVEWVISIPPSAYDDPPPLLVGDTISADYLVFVYRDGFMEEHECVINLCKNIVQRKLPQSITHAPEESFPRFLFQFDFLQSWPMSLVNFHKLFHCSLRHWCRS